MTGVLLGLIVQELGGDSTVAIFSALLYVLGIAVLLPDRLGMDDPQLFAEAFTMAGLYCYIKSRNSRVLLCASALAFCLGVFTKQNLIAFPAAVAVDLLIRSRKRLAIWLGATVVFAALFTVLTFAIDGRFFLLHLLGHPAYSLSKALSRTTHFYLLTFQGVMLVAMVWTLSRFRSQPLLAAAFLISNALAFVLVGGDGVDLNIYFNGFAAAVLVCGAALSDIERFRSGPQPDVTSRPVQGSVAVTGSAIAAALMACLVLCGAIRFPDRLREGL